MIQIVVRSSGLMVESKLYEFWNYAKFAGLNMCDETLAKLNGFKNADMKKVILIMLVAVFSFVACQETGMLPLTEDSVLSATIEQDNATKTEMDADNNILWSENDQIVAFMKSSYGHRYQVKSSFIGKSYGDFSMVSSDKGNDLSAGNEWEHNVAYYPYSETVECLKSGEHYLLDVVLPEEQDYAAQSFGNGAMAMVAVSETNNITFRNVVGGIKFKLKGTQKVVSISLEGKDGEKLSGAAEVTAYTDGTKPSVTMASDASTSVILDCGSGVQLNESTATEFILTLPPVLFSKGFSVNITSSEGNVYAVETDKVNEVFRSSILVMPTVILKGTDEVEFETGLPSKRLISVEEVGYDYYVLDVIVPEEVSAAGNHLHFSFTDAWSVKYGASQSGREVDECVALSLTGSADFCSRPCYEEWFYSTNQTRRYVVGENLYEGADRVTPGEPIFVVASEVTPEGELEGVVEVLKFRTKEPAKLDAELEVRVEETTAVDAVFSIMPDDGIEKYYYIILSDDDYEQCVSWLDGEDDLQWLVTSAHLEWFRGSCCSSGEISVKISDFYDSEAITPDTRYHLLLTGYGDEIGTSQCFRHLEFETTSKKRTMAPVMEVIPLPEESTYFSAAFNVRCTSYDDPASGPVVSCVSGVNYVHNWLYEDDYSSLLSRSGTKFTEDQLAEINSAQGYTVNFPVIDGMELRFGVMGQNDENDSSGAVTVDYATPYYKAESVASDFLTTDILEGEWVMTATDVDGNELETTVNIVRSLKEGRDYQSECPDEFIEQVSVFNQRRLADKNSLLIQGWFLDSVWGEDGPYALRSPYDLLMSEDYVAQTYQQLFFDAGPKIFLEVKPDGNLVITSDAHRYMPVEGWGSELYFGGISDDCMAALGNYSPETPSPMEFPVTISEDYRTITIDPAIYEGVTYYPNVLRLQGYLYADIFIKSSITLKKK